MQRKRWKWLRFSQYVWSKSYTKIFLLLFRYTKVCSQERGGRDIISTDCVFVQGRQRGLRSTGRPGEESEREREGYQRGSERDQESKRSFSARPMTSVRLLSRPAQHYPTSTYTDIHYSSKIHKINPIHYTHPCVTYLRLNQSK